MLFVSLFFTYFTLYNSSRFIYLTTAASNSFLFNGWVIFHCGLPRWLNGKESTCNAKDIGLIPGSANPLEKEMATHSLGNPMDRGAWWATVHGVIRRHKFAVRQQQQHSIVYMYHIFFIHSSVNGHQNHSEVSPHTSVNGHHKKKKSINNKCWRGCGEKETLLWECKLNQPLWRTVWRVLKN